ncbi:DUF4286 family protein [Pedobacter sp. HMF7647]|uniref:DUF4286 family protein n=1 Tax=Hufsiella arboris TaxID=2695275 RepID=A0A7K1Y474_9SPHI|nr:DUF4286 family protein [Hufsiella arboris]MXV49385.1 DUF4286 family protein [Hufsiella arboris]
MFLYNITVIVDYDIESQWLTWINNEHLPAVMDLGFVTSNRLLKVLNSPNEGITYCIQFVFETHEAYESYVTLHEKNLMQAHADLFTNKHVLFTTLMEYINYE